MTLVLLVSLALLVFTGAACAGRQGYEDPRSSSSSSSLNCTRVREAFSDVIKALDEHGVQIAPWPSDDPQPLAHHPSRREGRPIPVLELQQALAAACPEIMPSKDEQTWHPVHTANSDTHESQAIGNSGGLDGRLSSQQRHDNTGSGGSRSSHPVPLSLRSSSSPASSSSSSSPFSSSSFSSSSSSSSPSWLSSSSSSFSSRPFSPSHGAAASAAPPSQKSRPRFCNPPLAVREPDANCSLTDIVSCACNLTAATVNGALNISVDAHDAVPTQPHARECLRNLTRHMAPTALWLSISADAHNLPPTRSRTRAPIANVARGTASPGLERMNSMTGAVVQWVFESGAWHSLRSFALRGFTAASLDLSKLVSPGFGGARELETLDLHSNLLDKVTSPGQQLPSLAALDASNNLLTEVPTAFLHGTPNLTQLDLRSNMISRIGGTALPPAGLQCIDASANFITEIEPGVFGQQHEHLGSFNFSNNQLTVLPTGICKNKTSVPRIDLSYNYMTALPAEAFKRCPVLSVLSLAHNALTQLQAGTIPGTVAEVFLHSNNISFVADGAIEPSGNLKTLSLNHNSITSLPVSFFHSFFNLEVYDLAHNRLRALPRNLTLSAKQILLADFSHNELTRIDGLVVETPQSLDLSFNQLTHIDVTVARSGHVFVLDLNNNPLHKLPPVPSTLNQLHARNHRIAHLDLTRVAGLALDVLDLDAHPGAASVASIDPGVLEQWDLSQYRVLRLANVALPKDVVQRLAKTGKEFSSLHLGWSGLGADVLDALDLCATMSHAADDLLLVNTSYTSLDLCRGKQFHTLSLQDNPALTHVDVFSSLRRLNVSGCPQLATLSVPAVDELDISRTRVAPGSQLCRTVGTEMLVARDLHSPQFGTNTATRLMLERCLTEAAVLDLSDNDWLDSLSLLQPVDGRTVVISGLQGGGSQGGGSPLGLPTREYPQLLLLQNTPVTCDLLLTAVDLSMGYTFVCECAREYKTHHASGRCVPDKPSYGAVAAGSAVGGAAAALCLFLAVRWLLRARARRQWLQLENATQRRELQRREEEVHALKGAWKIDFEELRLERRVAAGAYGVVYRAKWDALPVAVKVLQESVAMLDESTKAEVEKEAEFLQRTRHPHLVRFFGTGADPSGNPFLVLEFVELGSLKQLLQARKLEGLLRDHRHHSAHEWQGGGDGDDDDDDDDDERVGEEQGHGEARELVSVNGNTVAHLHDSVPDTVWELKLRLLRDVASGMAFIHAKGHVHRDLKSGNVLVSQRLRAKITDFGSIRQCLLQPRVSARQGALTITRERADMTVGVGTPLYMAPEVLVSGRYDAKADVFSFGVLMWEVATQCVPDLVEQEKGPGFRGPLLSTLSNLLNQGKRLSFQGRADIAEWYQDLALRCMAQDASARPTFHQLEHGRLTVQ